MMHEDGSFSLYLDPSEGRITNFSVSARKGVAGTVFKIELVVTEQSKIGWLIDDLQRATKARKAKDGQ